VKFSEPIFTERDLDLFETYISDIVDNASQEYSENPYTLSFDFDPLYP